jgi:hypothetical protein
MAAARLAAAFAITGAVTTASRCLILTLLPRALDFSPQSWKDRICCGTIVPAVIGGRTVNVPKYLETAAFIPLRNSIRGFQAINHYVDGGTACGD